jgi:hypothetical protein
MKAQPGGETDASSVTRMERRVNIIAGTIRPKGPLQWKEFGAPKKHSCTPSLGAVGVEKLCQPRASFSAWTPLLQPARNREATALAFRF